MTPEMTAAPSRHDDARLLQALDEYQAALQAGQRPDHGEFLAQYPDLAAALAECLAGLDFVHAAGPALSHPVVGSPSASPATLLIPAGIALGDFHIVRELGRGGMGIVYEAMQLSLGRRVALKLLPFVAALDPRQLQRFKNEAQAAQLHHPNIVPVHGEGCERGVHYYAMQLIEGQTLATMIAALRGDFHASGLHPAGLAPADVPTGPETPTRPVAAVSTEHSPRNPAFFRAAAMFGVQAAEALEHAHQFGVVHRDIKPANLLVDERQNLWVVDFGLAQIQSDTRLTLTGDVLGTLRYMSPEQALAKRVPIDHRTDIYSLGVTLYELLTLEPAFDGRDRQELLRQIAFEEPRPPRQLNRVVPADLETIVLKAMAKNPEKRYTTALEVAADLRRFLEDKPIRAKRPTALKVTRKWARRHRTLVRAALVSGVLLLAGAVLALAVSDAAIRREQAETDKVHRALELDHYFQTIALAERERAAGNVGLAEQLLDSCPPALRGWEWYYLKRLRYGSPYILAAMGCVRGLAVSPDGRFVAFAGHRTVRIWDLAGGRFVHDFKAHQDLVFNAAWSPDSRLLATAGWDGTVRVWNAMTWAQRLELQAPSRGRFLGVAFSPDGRRLASSSDNANTVQVWDVATGQTLLTLTSHNQAIFSVAYSPDGRRLASAAADRLVKVWDATTGAELYTLPPHASAVHAVTFSPDGRLLATAGGDAFFDGDAGEVKLWDAATGALLHDLRGHTGVVFGVAFSPDGRRLASAGGEDRTVRLWDVARGKEALMLRGHTEGVWRVAFSPDGQQLFSGSDDQTVRIWDAALPMETGDQKLHLLFIRPDPDPLLSGKTNLGAGLNQVQIIPPGHRAPGDAKFTTFQKLDSHRGRVNSIAFSPEGPYLASAGMDRRVILWDVAAGRKVRILPSHPYPVQALAFGLTFDPFCLQLASVSRVPESQFQEGRTGEVKVWEVPSGRLLTQFPAGHSWGCLGVAFGPKCRTLALASHEVRVLLCDGTTGSPLRAYRGDPDDGLATSVAFTSSGRQLASIGVRGLVTIWDVPDGLDARMLTTLGTPPSLFHGIVRAGIATTGEPVRTFQAHTGRGCCIAFRRNGELATAGFDGLIKLWDPATGKLLQVLRGHQGSVQSIAISRHGRYLVSGGSDAAVRVWDLEKGMEILDLWGSTGTIYSVAISPDSQRIAAAGADGTIRLWEVNLAAWAPDRPN